jgi:oligosaccharide repeat unit polymerase
MNIFSIICFTFVVLILISSFIRKSDKFSPLRLFIIIWLFAIGLTNLKLSYFQSEWAAISWILLFTGLTSFILGYLVVYVNNIGSPILSISEIRNRMQTLAINEPRFILIICFLFLIYVISYLAIFSKSGFVPALNALPSETRSKFTMFGFGLLIHYAPVIMFLIVEYFALAKEKNPFKIFILSLFFILALVSYFLILQRMNLFLWLIMTIVMLYYVRRKIKLRTVIFILTSFIILMIAIMNIRLVKHVENFIYLTSKMKFGPAYAFITEPYMYICMNLENFARGVEKLDYNTFGYFTFNPLLAISGLKSSIQANFYISETPFLVSGYNTYPFLWNYFYDFGVLGIFLFPFLFGLLVGVLYFKLRKKPDLVCISLYSIVTFSIAMSFFVNAFNLLHYVFNIITIVVVHVYLTNKKSTSTIINHPTE